MNKRSLLAKIVIFVQVFTLSILTGAIALSSQVYSSSELRFQKSAQSPICNIACRRTTVKGASKIVKALRKELQEKY